MLGFAAIERTDCNRDLADQLREWCWNQRHATNRRDHRIDHAGHRCRRRQRRDHQWLGKQSNAWIKQYLRSRDESDDHPDVRDPMSRDNPSNFTEWWQNLPIPWLVSGPNGTAEATANGTVLDGQIDLLRQAAKVIFPDNAPSDALPYLAHDRVLIQGPTETEANFRTRLRTSWNDWARAGTPLELLVQLYWGGFGGAVIVQQSGLAYSLSGVPTAGQDPTSLLVITTLDAAAIPITPVSPSVNTIPANTPWWTFDSLNDMGNRFTILFPTSAQCFTTCGRASFSATDNATVTWNNPNAFAETSYTVYAGLPVVTDTPTSGVGVWHDPSAKTATSTLIRASEAFTGYVDVLAAPAGVDPIAWTSSIDLGRLQSIIRSWRPAKALCVGICVLVQGSFWGWPVSIWGDGGTWGAASSINLEGA